MRREYEAPELLVSVLNVQNITNNDEFGEGEDEFDWDENWSSLLNP